MNKKLIIGIIIGVLVIVLIGGAIVLTKQLLTPKQKTNPKKEEEKNVKETKLPSYPEAVVDVDKCGKDAFYVEEKSADFVKNYCKFLRDNGWKLVHQDYPDCEDIMSFGGGYNYEKGLEKLSISVIRYGENATCFWVYPK